MLIARTDQPHSPSALIGTFIVPQPVPFSDMADKGFVTLVSSDGFEFVIPRSAACVSGTIRRMLDPASTFTRPRHPREVLC